MTHPDNFYDGSAAAQFNAPDGQSPCYPVTIEPCPSCGKPPGQKVGPPAVARCITPDCPGSKLGAKTLSDWNVIARASQPATPTGCLCQDRHRRGYCTEPGCSLATRSSAGTIEAVAREVTAECKAEMRVRGRLANNGRNPANNNEGIRVGSDLHLMEMLIKEIDSLRSLAQPAQRCDLLDALDWLESSANIKCEGFIPPEVTQHNRTAAAHAEKLRLFLFGTSPISSTEGK